MKQIYNNLYQFTMVIPPIDFTIHQYLLDIDEPILIGTGTLHQAEEMLPKIQEILKDKELKYILVSHFESDECGGLSVFKKAYPNAQVVCSELTARELMGFGYNGEVVAKKGGETLGGQGFDLIFIDYSAEVHLQNGLVFMEKESGVFFSSDLMLRMGNGSNKVINGNWKDEVEKITLDRVCNEEKKELLKAELMKFNPKFIAVGHGFCVEL